jgi:hypothetical protein
MDHRDVNRSRGARRSEAWFFIGLLLLWGLAVGWLTLEAVSLIG